MRWHLAHSDDPIPVQRQIELYRKRGLPLPAGLLPPKMLPGAQEWLSAFFDLSTERAYGFTVGPIPASAIRAWPVDPSEADAFAQCIKAMDRAFLSHGKKDQVVGTASVDTMRTLKDG